MLKECDESVCVVWTADFMRQQNFTKCVCVCAGGGGKCVCWMDCRLYMQLILQSLVPLLNFSLLSGVSFGLLRNLFSFVLSLSLPSISLSPSLLAFLFISVSSLSRVSVPSFHLLPLCVAVKADGV